MGSELISNLACKFKQYADQVSAALHTFLLFLAITGFVLLIAYPTGSYSKFHYISFSIFGTGMILVSLASSMYHYTKRRRFRNFDLSAIFIHIAGSTTPLSLVVLYPKWGYTPFIIFWSLAFIGILLINLKKIPDWILFSTYVLVPCVMLFYFPTFFGVLSDGAICWLLVGGGFYILGLGLIALFEGKGKPPKYFGPHEVHHICVIIGCFCHFMLMWLHIRHI